MDKCGKTHRSYKFPDDSETIIEYFPSNTTSRLQPMDLGINKPFKDRIRYLWEEWMSNESNISLTNSGYRRSVPRQTFINLVEDSWQKINTETITNSFNVLRKGLDEIEDLILN